MAKVTSKITDMALWDDFVDRSPQGTIFSESRWLNAIGEPHQIWGYFINGNLVGGMANFDKPAPLTPFQGILVKPLDGKYATQLSTYNEVTRALLPYVPDEFCNHYTFTDIRPFLWDGSYTTYIRYTFLMDLRYKKEVWNGLEKQTRYDIAHYMGEVTADITLSDLDRLYGYTFRRKGLVRTAPSDLLYRINHHVPLHIYGSKDVKVMVVMVRDFKRSYYILGASDGKGGSAHVLMYALNSELLYSNECDLVGCNDELISRFKRGFGGKLMPYYGVKRCTE